MRFRILRLRIDLSASPDAGLSRRSGPRIATRRHGGTIRPMTRCGRHRMRIALVVILCLLFQQVAMAAYACTLDRMPPDPVVMTEACEQIGMQQVKQAPAQCAKHCAPDLSVAADHAAAPSVPALALPAAAYELVLEQPMSHGMSTEVPVARSDPPARLRYCSLLI